MSMQKNICLNCGKNGHQYKLCEEPIISYGIVCFNINSLLINNKQIDRYLYNQYLDTDEFNYLNLDNLSLIPYFNDKIKFLMIRRKHSLNYIEFVRGKYTIDNIEQLSKLFQLMTFDENIKIKELSFENIWDDLWKDTARIKIYQKEFNMSKSKFETLKSNNFYNLLDESKLSIYKEPEWGFPKGRRNLNEKNMNCAIREFIEETNIDIQNINILERLNPITEEYIGTNSINYRHVYYLASSEKELELSINNDSQLYEVGDIKWVTLSECINKVRPYYEKRMQMINHIYFFLINLIINITNNKNNKQILSSIN